MSHVYSYDVFLSHKSEDKPLVQQIAERLRDAGLKVWYDDWVLRPGDDVYLEIENGLQSSRIMVLCMSQSAFDSNWVKLERNTVLFRDPSNKDRRFIPVLLDDCDIPVTIKRYKYIDYRSRSESALNQLISICKSDRYLAAEDKKISSARKIREKTRVTRIRSIEIADTVLVAICPILEKIGQVALAANLREKASNLYAKCIDANDSPVVLLGITGHGKTTLLNALLDEIVGVSGGGGPQSAASLTISHSPDNFIVKVIYMTLQDIQTLIDTAKIDTRRKFTKRPDEQGLSKFQQSFFERVFKNIEIGILQEVTIDDLQDNVVELLKKKSVTRMFSKRNIQSMKQFIREHTNTRGENWALTKHVSVSGPFSTLRSDVKIMDLPGLGDLNRVRLQRTLDALSKANQIIVVIGDKGFTGEIKSLLGDTQIISYLLTADAPQRQITIVGTHLDSVNVSEFDLEELGLDDSCSNKEIVTAKFERWVEIVKSQWRNLLIDWSVETKLQISNQDNAIEKIINNTDFIPTSPLGYLCLIGKERDRTSLYKTIFKLEDGNIDLSKTGIPAVRDSINKLVEEQERLRNAQIQHFTNDILESVELTCVPILDSLLGEIKHSEGVRKNLSTTRKKLLRLRSRKRVYSFSKSKAHAKKSLQAVRPIVNDGWSELDSSNIKELLNTHVGKLHYQTLKAALRRKGVYKVVDIPREIGVYIVDPMSELVNTDVLPSTMKMVVNEITHKSQILLRDIVMEIIESLPKNEVTASFSFQAMSVLQQYEKDINNLCKLLQPNIDTLKIGYESVASALNSVMLVALDEKGRGARQRTINVMAELAEMKLSIIKKEIFVTFNSAILEKIEDILSVLDEDLMLKRHNAIDQILEISEFLANTTENKMQKSLAKELQIHLQSIL